MVFNIFLFSKLLAHFRTAKRLGIESVVAVYSDPDSNAQHVRMCNGPGDLAFRIGEAASLKSYLRAEKIIEVAKQANVQVHIAS